MEFLGVVSSFHLTNDKKTYAVVKFKNKMNVNYHIYLPGEEANVRLGQKVKVQITPVS